MLRTALGLGVVAALLATAGCTMCCHPYDYCGPIHDGRGCPSCPSRAREGSILSGMSEMAPSAAMAPSAEVTRRPVRSKSESVASRTKSDASLTHQVQGDARPGDVPGSERIVSVTDRVVDPSASSDEPPQVASESSTESAMPLPSKGWTARRPTPQVIR